MKYSIILLSLLTSLCSYANTESSPHRIGASYGHGKPNSINGYRLHYAYQFLDCDWWQMDLDASFAQWKMNTNHNKHMSILALGPILRVYPLQGHELGSRFFLEASVGGAYQSKKTFGNKRFGSKWTFQDLLGFGFNVNKNLDLRVHYLHYSNAKLAKPNPGIDILPLLTLTYKF